MPKDTTADDIRRIIDEASSKVREIVAKQIGQQLGATIVPTVVGPPAPIPEGVPVTARGTVRKRAILCPVPKCGLVGAGPVKDWFCKKHWDQYKDKDAERQRLKQDVRRRPQLRPKAIER